MSWIGLTALVIAMATAQESAGPDELQMQIDAYAAYRANLEKPLTDLANQYQAQLSLLKTQVQSKGNLEQALAVENEIKTFRSGESAPAKGDFTELQKLQTIYQRSAAARQKPIEKKLADAQSKHLQSLRNLQSKLTQASRLTDAVAVKTYADSIEGKLAEAKEAAKMEETLFLELFWEPNFAGVAVKLPVPSEIDSFAEAGSLRNDALRSIRIPDGVRVILGTGRALDGKTITLRRDTPDIDLSGISSLKAR